jgi:hypothetical protein
MPTFDDERLLPFLGAFIKEVTRCAFLDLSIPPTPIDWRFDVKDGAPWFLSAYRMQQARLISMMATISPKALPCLLISSTSLCRTIFRA